MKICKLRAEGAHSSPRWCLALQHSNRSAAERLWRAESAKAAGPTSMQRRWAPHVEGGRYETAGRKIMAVFLLLSLCLHICEPADVRSTLRGEQSSSSSISSRTVDTEEGGNVVQSAADTMKRMMDIEGANQPTPTTLAKTQDTISQIRSVAGSDSNTAEDILLRKQLDDLDSHEAKHTETMEALKAHQEKLEQMRSALVNASEVLGVHLEHAQARERNGTVNELKNELERLIKQEVSEQVGMEMKRLEGKMMKRMDDAIESAAGSLGKRASVIANHAIETRVGEDVHKLLLEPPYKTEGPLVELIRDEVGIALDNRLENAVLKEVDNVTSGVVDGLKYEFDDVKTETEMNAGDGSGNQDGDMAASQPDSSTPENNRFRGSRATQLVHRHDAGADGYRDSADEATSTTEAPADVATVGTRDDTTTAAPQTPPKIRRDYSGQPDFSYDPFDSVYGPVHWGEIDAAYRKCGSGRHQSPVDVRTAAVSSLSKANVRMDDYLQPIFLTYEPVSPTVIQNNGHAIDLPVNLPIEGVASDPSTKQLLQYGAVDYTLRKVNVHTPGEHSVDGKRPLMELHLIHEANSAYKGMASRWAIIVVPFFEAPTQGDGDAFLDLWWDDIPPIGEQQVLDATTLNLVTGLFGGGLASGTNKDPAITIQLPASSFYTYSGSLTTPPCTENARYFILKAEAYPHRVTLRQATQVTKLLNGTNSRPIQNNNWDPTDPTDRLQVLTKGPWLGAPIGSVMTTPQSSEREEDSGSSPSLDASAPNLKGDADQTLLSEAAGSAADTVADLKAQSE